VCKKYVSKVDSATRCKLQIENKTNKSAATKLARGRNKSKEREHCNKASKSKKKEKKGK